MTLSKYCCSITSVTATRGGLFRSLGCTLMSDSMVVSMNICARRLSLLVLPSARPLLLALLLLLQRLYMIIYEMFHLIYDADKALLCC